MASITKILLKGGTVLRHDDLDHVTPTITDILIEGSKIVEISPGIHNNDAEVIDCSDYIVSPGFVDTHHHVYQTQFKGVHADQMLSDFLAHGTSGNFAAKHLTAEGVYWGQLAGCMEMIDAGTTTVVDYAFINPSLDYSMSIGNSVYVFSIQNFSKLYKIRRLIVLQTTRRFQLQCHQVYDPCSATPR